jgi:carbon monoxide dehydrogenase subunit G
MKVHNELRLNVPIDQAWDLLNDIPRVARCAPGAQLLESRPDDSHVGTIAVKLGPVALTFKGTVAFLEKDAANHRVVAKAQGNEEKARGTATADVVFTLAADGEGTKLSVDSDITLAGYIAQYGRGAALIQSTAQVIMGQFAKNLEADLNSGGTAEMQKDISGAKVLAQGLWNAGTGLFAKDSNKAHTSDKD